MSLCRMVKRALLCQTDPSDVRWPILCCLTFVHVSLESFQNRWHDSLWLYPVRECLTPKMIWINRFVSKFVAIKTFVCVGRINEWITWWTSWKLRLANILVSSNSLSRTIFSGKPTVIRFSAFLIKPSLYSCT